jgi:NAD(P)-dependent dehydrogenase (short-subunit alcohol dehydrogenase family)
MKVAIVGATKGMGRALARELAARGDSVCVLGRSADEVERSAADLRARAATVTIGTAHCDLEDPTGFDAALVTAREALGGLDTIVVTAAMFGVQQALESDPTLLGRMLTVNFTNTVLFCESARRHLLGNGGGTLCVFSSVAGDRGRKPVVLYGAAKAGLSAYLEGLDHRFHADGLRVVTVKPGFVRTAMTAGLAEPPFAGDPDDVARRVAKALVRGTPVVYAPGIWRWVMLVIRWLPRFVMRRVGF